MFNLKLLIPLMLLVACAEAPIVKPVRTGHEGERVPKFSLLLMDRLHYYSSSDLPIDKTNIIFYFSPTCPHCRVQMRTIVENMDRLKDVQFTILTIADYASTLLFYERYKLSHFSNVKIGIDTGYIFPSFFKTDKVPFLAIYKDGILKNAFIGSIGFAQLKNEIQYKAIAQSIRP